MRSLLKLWGVILIFLLAAAGCNNNKPQPETKVLIEEIAGQSSTVPVMSQARQRVMNVKHEIRGSDLYIECIVANFSFKSGKGEKVDGEGHINVYLNGQKVDEVSTAAFVIKGLPTGKHRVRLELVHNDSSQYGISHEFEVNIS